MVGDKRFYQMESFHLEMFVSSHGWQVSLGGVIDRSHNTVLERIHWDNV